MPKNKSRIDTKSIRNRNALFIYLTVACLSLVFLYGVAVGVYRLFPYSILAFVKDSVTKVYEEKETLTKTKPKHFLQPARYDGDGVTVNKVPDGRADLILLSGFFDDGNELRLIRRDGTIVARWPVRFFEIFPDASHMPQPIATDWNIDINGMLILPDGSVVFTFEYGGLVKLTRCGDPVWTLARATHHSVERAEKSGYWVSGTRYYSSESDSPYPPFETPFREDTLLKVSENNDVLAEISVPGLYYKNGLEAILTATGEPLTAERVWDREIVHLNKIDELTTDIAGDFPLFEAGDLALSLRKLNMVMVIDPDTEEVKWWRIGPWLRQHDPEFKPGGTIVVFNNNTFRTAYGTGPDISNPRMPRVSNIVELDPMSDEYDVIYGGREGQEILSVIRGKHELTPHGGLLITEFEGGRVFETDATGNVIWEYINRYNSDEVAEINEARVYPESYFTVSDWSCEARG